MGRVGRDEMLKGWTAVRSRGSTLGQTEGQAANDHDAALALLLVRATPGGKDQFCSK